MLRPSQLLTTAAIILALASVCVAQENKARIKKQTPTVSGSTGLFNLPTADTLREGEFSFGLSGSKFNREPGDIDITVFPVTFTLGLNDRIEFFAAYELYKRVHATGIRPNTIAFDGLLTPTQLAGGGPASYYNDTPFLDLGFGSGSGDLGIGFKFSLMSERRGNAFGLALQPFARFAIDNDRVKLAQGLSPGNNDYGVDLILSKYAGAATLTAKLGFQFAEDFADLNRRVERQNRLNYGFGVGIPLGTPKVHFIGEGLGSLFWGDRVTQFVSPALTLETALGNPRSPFDFYVGFRAHPAKWVAIGIAYNLYVNRLDSPTAFSPTDQDGWLAQVVFQRKINRPPTIACSASPTSVEEGQSISITATITDPDDDVLTVTWTSNGGRLSSSDMSATLDTSGLSEGSYSVKAEATDGDSVAACSVDVQVAKRRMPPTVRCEPTNTTVSAGGTAVIRAIASDPNGDTLTFSWSVDGQPVTNSSSSFEFGSTGRSPGVHTIRVTVTDSDNMSASCESRVTVDERPNNNPTCSLTLNNSQVFAGESITATLRANDPDGDRLTFSWSVDNRSLSATGTTATINTSGMAGGSHTVTVTARDERGATCTDTANFSVREKITIPVDNRVDNVAKARLDEIALRMRQNPRLRATLTGHADSRGSDEVNQAAGLRRAEMVKDYLVNEPNSIDPSRIETRSAGESQPIADNETEEGRKRNRRVDMELYVP